MHAPPLQPRRSGEDTGDLGEATARLSQAFGVDLNTALNLTVSTMQRSKMSAGEVAASLAPLSREWGRVYGGGQQEAARMMATMEVLTKRLGSQQAAVAAMQQQLATPIPHAAIEALGMRAEDIEQLMEDHFKEGGAPAVERLLERIRKDAIEQKMMMSGLSEEVAKKVLGFGEGARAQMDPKFKEQVAAQMAQGLGAEGQKAVDAIIAADQATFNASMAKWKEYAEAWKEKTSIFNKALQFLMQTPEQWGLLAPRYRPLQWRHAPRSSRGVLLRGRCVSVGAKRTPRHRQVQEEKERRYARARP